MNVRVWLVLLVVCCMCRAVTLEDLSYPLVHKNAHLLDVSDAANVEYGSGAQGLRLR